MTRNTAQTQAGQRGAALLLAMLVVTLVATIAAAALWQQWRAIEVETAERRRVQAGLLLTGALDWARLILREDARGNLSSGNADHLGEPWATPLAEARLSSFLAADQDNNTEDLMPAFLSGSMVDHESRLNASNLVRITGNGAARRASLSEPDLAAFVRLYDVLGLPSDEIRSAANALVTTTQLGLTDPEPSATPLIPRRFAQLGWLGVSAASLKALAPHVTVLPDRTTLNLNTASAEALSASVPGLDLAAAQTFVGARADAPLADLEAAKARLPGEAATGLSAQHHAVRSRHFEVRIRLRLDDMRVEEHSTVVRNGTTISVLWRTRVPAS